MLLTLLAFLVETVERPMLLLLLALLVEMVGPPLLSLLYLDRMV